MSTALTIFDFTQFVDQIDNHFPADQLLQFAQRHFLIFPKKIDERSRKEAMVVVPLMEELLMLLKVKVMYNFIL